MNELRATTHLAEGANTVFFAWIEQLHAAGIEIVSEVGDDTSLEADVVFACGLLTALHQRDGEGIRIVGAPILPGETGAVYRSALVARSEVSAPLRDSIGLRLAVNEYASWSGWHGLKEHLRSTDVPAHAIGEHVITGGHVHSIEALIAGDADIASIDHSVWNARSAIDERLAELQVLECTRDWPAPPISIRSTLPPSIQGKLFDTIAAFADVQPADRADYAFMLAEFDQHPTWP